jgi:hypothetical protein
MRGKDIRLSALKTRKKIPFFSKKSLKTYLSWPEGEGSRAPNAPPDVHVSQ